jgi:hypothetical protein
MKKLSRRSFIKSTSGATAGILAAPLIINSCMPSKQVTIGMIGTGGHCMGWNLPPFLAMERCQGCCCLRCGQKENARCEKGH